MLLWLHTLIALCYSVCLLNWIKLTYHYISRTIISRPWSHDHFHFKRHYIFFSDFLNTVLTWSTFVFRSTLAVGGIWRGSLSARWRRSLITIWVLNWSPGKTSPPLIGRPKGHQWRSSKRWCLVIWRSQIQMHYCNKTWIPLKRHFKRWFNRVTVFTHWKSIQGFLKVIYIYLAFTLTFIVWTQNHFL